MFAVILAVAAQAASPSPIDLSMLCAGWAGGWRTETDMGYQNGVGWSPGTQDPNWSVEATAPGKCLFRFDGGAPQFALDTTQGYYDTTFYKDGKPDGAPQRGRVLHAELVEPRAWNVVVEAPAKAGTYRMQMTMAGDVFMIYMTAPGADAARLKPDGIAVHRRAKP